MFFLDFPLAIPLSTHITPATPIVSPHRHISFLAICHDSVLIPDLWHKFPSPLVIFGSWGPVPVIFPVTSRREKAWCHKDCALCIYCLGWKMRTLRKKNAPLFPSQEDGMRWWMSRSFENSSILYSSKDILWELIMVWPATVPVLLSYKRGSPAVLLYVFSPSVLNLSWPSLSFVITYLGRCCSLWNNTVKEMDRIGSQIQSP